jgi:O-methyltransferase
MNLTRKSKKQKQLPINTIGNLNKDLQMVLRMNDNEILNFVSPYTVCDNARILNVLQVIDWIAKENIPGDFVEAGVYKGGIIMAMALKCKQLGLTRKIYAYDTFSGMTAPTGLDIDINNMRALDLMDKSSYVYSEAIHCKSSLEETKENFEKTGYSNVVFCEGDILQTSLHSIPQEIALLRLDTDWYESTKFELDHFEPQVRKGGYVIVDDYGHWKGSRKAVDDFLLTHPQQVTPVDYTGIYWKKV